MKLAFHYAMHSICIISLANTLGAISAKCTK
jgi:hypothetical protein